MVTLLILLLLLLLLPLIPINLYFNSHFLHVRYMNLTISQLHHLLKVWDSCDEVAKIDVWRKRKIKLL